MLIPSTIDNRHGEPDGRPCAEHGLWWRDATIYQIYIPSFADGSGDGIGDLTGIQYRIGYLRDLGVDAIRLSPWHPSPMANGGYDIVDYRDIDPMFGDLDDAEDLITDAHRHGLRVIIDLVPNHCSIEHPWFQAALVAGPGSPQRERFWFRPGRGMHGETPPNDWRSAFGGSAWTQVTEPDGGQGEWYLHLFDVSQPDFNWSDSQVRAEFEQILRFWLGRGIDGFHIDAADRLNKSPLLPDHEDVHEIFRSWRRIVDSYPGERTLIGDIRLPDPEGFTSYLRPDELHSAANSDFLCSPWRAERLRAIIDKSIERHARIAAPPTWVLSNHAVTRHVTRYGRGDGDRADPTREGPVPVDLAVGTRRARAALLLTMALPGVVHVYQGDELGLWEVEDLSGTLSNDPIWRRFGHVDRGSDGCRVPLPWQAEELSFGFSPAESLGRPWLPQPREWRELSVQQQIDDPHSMLRLYRNALRIRRTELAGGSRDLAWRSAPAGTLVFARHAGFTCVVNFSAPALPLPPHHDVLLASGELELDGLVPPDTAVWLRPVDVGDVATEWPLAD